MNKKFIIFLLVFSFLLLLLISFYFYKDVNSMRELNSARIKKSKEIDTVNKKEENNTRFGLNIDSFDVHKGKVKHNEFLADILLKYKVDYPTIERIVNKSDTIFDVKHIGEGKNYTVFCDNEDKKNAKCFIYEPNDINYVVVDLRDSIHIYKGQKEVVHREKIATGVINSSLYMTIKKNDISPLVALELSEVYAWAIDFYRIQKGDKFKVIYEKRYVDGRNPIGVGKIKAARFNHRDSNYYAFYFEQGEKEKGQYFDENGKSLRKALLKAPLKFSRISSRFSNNRFHPVLKEYRAHHGVDYAAPRGTPVNSVGDGLVINAGYSNGNGNYVKIKHNSVYTTMYLHLSKFANGIKSGAKVKQGQKIAYVGSTGLSTGPHLDYRIYKNGDPVNPLKLELPPSKPVNEELMDNFMEKRNKYLKKLKSVPFKKKQIASSIN